MSDGRITTSYLDHEIVYAENEDVWRCWDLDVEGKTLSAVKEKIRKLDAEGRKVPDLPAFELLWNGTEAVPVTINMLDAEKDKVWVLKQEEQTITRPFGSTGPRQTRTVTKRAKVDMARVFLATPETDAILADLAKAVAAERKAHKHVEAVKSRLTPVTREMLVGVEKAEKRQPEWMRKRRRR